MHEQRTFVGRAAEVALIRRAARAALRSRGRLVVVGGEAGAGKSALVDRALSRCRLTVARRGTADAAVPFAPLVDAIRSHPAWPAGARRLLDPGWLPFIRPLLPEIDAQADPDGEVHRADTPGPAFEPLTEAFRSLVVALARCTPTALVVDDLQRSDAATLAVLAALASALEHEPLLVVVAYRSDELPRDNTLRQWLQEVRRFPVAREIALKPLDPDSVAALAEGVLGASPDRRLVEWLTTRSGGLPLFVEELTAALRAEGAIRVGNRVAALAGEAIRLPRTLRDAVIVRLEGLAPGIRESLAIAAIAGDPVPEELVAATALELGVAGRGWLRAGLERGLLRESGEGPRFRHDLVREVLAEELPADRARSAQAAIAARLAASGAEPLAVAEHWLAARRMDLAVEAFVAAADASYRVNAYPDAAAALRRALAGVPSDEAGTELILLERLAQCLELAGEVTEAASLLERVSRRRAQGGEFREAADDGRRCASLLELRGRWEHAIEVRSVTAGWYAEAGRPAEAAAERLAAAAHLRSAAAFTAARELLATALLEARAAERRDLEARIVGLDGNVLTRMGRAQEGLESVRRGLELALGLGLAAPAAELYQRLADSLEHAGQYAVARATYLEGADYCRRQSIEPSAQLCLACLGVVLFQTGDWRTAERTCREVIDSSQATPHAIAVAEGVLGLVAAMRGAVSHARPHLLASLALARHIELAAMELISLSGLARCDAQEGLLEAADERCRELLRRWEATEERHYAVPILRWAASFYGQRGDVDAARACANALAQIASETGQPDAVAALGVALGEAALLNGEAGPAADHFASALELVASRDLPVERAEIGPRAGVALVQAGRRRDGLAALVEAHRTARRLGAAPLARSIAGEIAALGEPIERRLGRREARLLSTGGLTRRELDVLRLVATGHTSRSIGEVLFISPRTAEMHVANAVAKLGCRNRAEATHRAAELGLLAEAVTV